MGFIETTNRERIDLIREVPVRDVVSPPGHADLRNPGAVVEISDAIAAGDLARLGAEPILLNIFPRDWRGGSPDSWSVHCIDGTHRLAGGLHSGRWRVLGDIPAETLEVWIEGWGVGDTAGPRPRWIPLEVAEASFISDWRDVSGHPMARGPSAEIRADIANDSVRFPEEHRGVRLDVVLRRSRQG